MEGDLRECRPAKNRLRREMMQMVDMLLTEMAEEQPHRDDVQHRFNICSSLLEQYRECCAEVRNIQEAYHDLNRNIALRREMEKVEDVMETLGIRVIEYGMHWDKLAVPEEGQDTHVKTQEPPQDAGTSPYRKLMNEIDQNLEKTERQERRLRQEQDRSSGARDTCTERGAEGGRRDGSRFEPDYHSTPTTTQLDHMQQRFHRLDVHDDEVVDDRRRPRVEAEDDDDDHVSRRLADILSDRAAARRARERLAERAEAAGLELEPRKLSPRRAQQRLRDWTEPARRRSEDDRGGKENYSRDLQPSLRDDGYDPNCSQRVREYRQPVGYQQYRASDLKVVNPLARMDVPKFSGDKRGFDEWWGDFMGMVHTSPIPTHQKMMRLRRALEGAAARVIQGLGDSEFAYDVALDALWERYGGQRRQLHLRYEDVNRMKPVREGSSQDLENFVETLNILVVKLKEMGQDRELEDGILYLNLQRKMPTAMLSRYFQWVAERGYNESVIALRKYLSQEARNVAKAEEASLGFQEARTTRRDGRPPAGRATTMVTAPAATGGARGGHSDAKCRLCSDTHGVWRCPIFLGQSVPERWTSARDHRLCFRCLSTQHRGETCSFSRKCGVDGCVNTHHRLLHDNRGRRVGSVAQGGANAPPVVSGLPGGVAGGRGERPGPADSHKPGGPPGRGAVPRTHVTLPSREQADVGKLVALRTVPVMVTNGTRSITVHALLDDASMRIYLNADIARLLSLEEEPAELAVSTLNNATTRLKSSTVSFRVRSLDGTFERSANAYTTHRVTGAMEVVDWRERAAEWSHLADVQFPEVGRRRIVDLLIGADVTDCHRVEEERYGEPGDPIARLTPFGWTCVGVVGSLATLDSTKFTFCCQDNASLLRNMERYWAVEEPEECSVVRPDEKHALLVAETTLAYVDGRYTLGVPWKPAAVDPQINYEMAKKRLEHTEKRLLRNEDEAVLYKNTIKDYLKKGYIREVTTEDDLRRTKWLLAHFPIVKLDRTTTKLRVVFDGAARYLGTSLNDLMLTGPKLQADLVHVLTRFRRYAIGVACDIQEMYLQIALPEGDRVYHRFLWRDLDASGKARVYEFLRWVFGNRAAPFGAHYVAKHNAEKHKQQYPEAATTIQDSTYMDDSMDSVKTVEAGYELYSQLVQLWARASMRARKWISNSRELLARVPDGELNACVDLEKDVLPQLKTLGVMWDTARDVFMCKVTADGAAVPTTKRMLLSKTATLFDPLGFFCPVTVVARILLQRTWMRGMDWDQPLPEDLQDSVGNWYQALPALEALTVPRACQSFEDVSSVQVHVFSDASLDAYGAVAYLRTEYADHPLEVKLLLAKVKVAPTSAVSVPRLELMAAVVGVRLAQKIRAVYGDVGVSYRYWSDSTDVLYWVRGQSCRFKPFVSNRVGVIQRLSEPADWHHIVTQENPADILSRGMSVEELCDSRLWLWGPRFLGLDVSEWPEGIQDFAKADECEEKTLKTYTATSISISDERRGGRVCMDDLRVHPARFSCVERCVHVLAFVWRFVDNCRKADRASQVYGALTPDEYQDAEAMLIRYAQQEDFKEELRALTHGVHVKTGSRVANLHPWLDTNDVMRMDSRLKNAHDVGWATKHPIILPKLGPVTELFIRQAHREAGHSGTNKTLAALTTKFWVLSGREAIRMWERRCMFCRRRQAPPSAQLMAPLPAERVSVPGRAFERTTLDFAGPFYAKQGRGKVRLKRYMCIFTCMATRAVHLELVYSMDTSAFLNAFTRMADRRGCPSYVVSDNGSNFVGADRELRQLAEQMDRNGIQHKTSARGVQWRFNPPAAPHFNGVHEALVKSAKRAVKKVLMKAEFTDEELLSAFTGAERMLNSRPLTYQSVNPQDWAPLTPTHFLVGHVDIAFPPGAVDRSCGSLRNRWRYVQETLRHFWKRWMSELLPQLGARAKWRRERRDTQVGDVVLVVSVDTPREQWPLARVTAVYPGQDGHVRAVDVRTKDGVYRRPIVKVCPLEDVS